MDANIEFMKLNKVSYERRIMITELHNQFVIRLPNNETVTGEFHSEGGKVLICFMPEDYEKMADYWKNEYARKMDEPLNMINGNLGKPVQSPDLMAMLAADVDDAYEPSNSDVELNHACRIVGYAKIREARKMKNLTQADMESLTGISQSQLSRIEAHPERADAQSLEKLGRALNIKILIE